jgi:hypothetical protein
MSRFCTYRYGLLALALGAVLACGARLVSGPQVKETVLGKLPPNLHPSGLALSPDGNRVAAVEHSGTGQVLVVDGVAWKKRYARISGVCFSPDSRRVGCVAEEGGEQFVVVDGVEGPRSDRVSFQGGLFSANSKHTAYMAARGRERFIVVDGVIGPKYQAVSDFHFSQDGEHHVYVGRRHRHDYRVVFDGAEDVQAHPSPLGPLCFSADGRQVAYVVTEVSGRQFQFHRHDLGYRLVAWSVTQVSDGTTVQRVQRHRADGSKDFCGTGYRHVHGDSLRFSLDGARLAFIAARGPGEEVMVLDGVEGKPHQMIERLYGFSRDGRHFAYIGDGKVIRDGVEGKDRVGAWELLFSPDGAHLAVAGVRNHRPVVLVDGVEVKGSANRIDQHVAFRFSPDGARLAFAARQSVFLNGVEGKRFAEVDGTSLTFSRDGTRLAYVAARRLGRYLVVTNGVEGKEYHEIRTSSLTFSADGAHLAYVARSGEKWVLVVDGVEVGTYDAFPASAPCIFDGPESLHAVALRERELVRVEVCTSSRWPW